MKKLRAVTAADAVTLKTARQRDRKFPEACWPDGHAESVRSAFNDKPCFKTGWRMIEDDTQW